MYKDIAPITTAVTIIIAKTIIEIFRFNIPIGLIRPVFPAFIA